jgi:hypothetical protein
MKTGVAAIFGPQSPHTASHVQSICDTMEVKKEKNTQKTEFMDHLSFYFYFYPSFNVSFHSLCLLYIE